MSTDLTEETATVNDDVEHLEDVDWQVDDDGTEFFVHAGVRYELAEDGFAYAVEDAVTDHDAATASPPLDEPGAADQTRQLPASPSVTIVADDEVARERTTAIPAVSATEPRGPQRPADAPPYASPASPAPASRPATAPTGQGTLLRIEGLRSGYGKLPVLHGVDLQIDVGQTAVLFGLNGAGKTTTAMNIAGALGTWDGRIEFDGQDATGWSIRKAVTNGIVMVPEGRKVFPELDVARNLQVGSWLQRKDRRWVNEQREQVLEYFPRLRERLAQAAGTLSGGEQQMLAIARGLMARPRLLIIDEASMGLAPVIVNDVFDIVRQINADGVTVLMIEQNVGALDVADRGIVMAQGRVVTELHGDQLEDRSVVSELLMG